MKKHYIFCLMTSMLLFGCDNPTPEQPKEKEYYADQNSVLIDDFRKNCEAFANGGGQFVKYETPRQTKDDLITILGG